jgi:hypothetical protein
MNGAHGGRGAARGSFAARRTVAVGKAVAGYGVIVAIRRAGDALRAPGTFCTFGTRRTITEAASGRRSRAAVIALRTLAIGSLDGRGKPALAMFASVARAGSFLAAAVTRARRTPARAFVARRAFKRPT